MNVKFIAAGAGLIGVGVGAVYAWAITADLAEQKAQRMTAEFERMDEKLREKMGYSAHLELENERLNTYVDELEQKLLSNTEISPEGDSAEIVSPDEVEAFPEGETPAETRARLQEQVRQYTNVPGAAEFIGEEAERVVVESSKQEPPFVISQLEFADANDEEGGEYGKSTYTYYEKGRVLLDENDEVVPQREVDHMVGWRNLSRFGDQSGQPDVVFIRNRRTETDYEVVLEADEEPPAYVKYGMDKEEWDARKSAGSLKFREGDV